MYREHRCIINGKASKCIWKCTFVRRIFIGSMEDVLSGAAARTGKFNKNKGKKGGLLK